MLQPSHKEQGVLKATNYIWKQHWKLKWLTAVIAGSMIAYSYITNEWIPMLSFNLVSWALLLIAQVMSQISLNRLFVIYVGGEQQGTDFSEEKIKSEITQHAWVHWAIANVFWYWLGVLIFTDDLFNLTL